MSVVLDVEPPAPALRSRAALGFAIAWLVFWVFQFLIVLAEHCASGRGDFWQPALWEATSMLVSSVLAVLYWRNLRQLDRWLARPFCWFGMVIGTSPLVAFCFAVGVLALRLAIYAALGRSYEHAPWHDLVPYEMLVFSTYYLLFMAILFGVRSFMAMGAAHVAIAREKALAQHAQLLQLTQQLQPHFLFNSLTSIVEAIHKDPFLAERLLLDLAQLLRAATDLSHKPEATLEDELSLLRAYASIMLQRFADRASVHFEIDDAARACVVPSLLLQPLLENAFRHGVERRSEPCAVVVAVQRRGDLLRLEVRDDAGRLSGTPIFGVGLSNLRQRLMTRYGALAELNLIAAPERGVTARIELPCES